MKFTQLLFFFAIFIHVQVFAQSQKERITNFEVDIKVMEDRSIQVKETISVYSSKQRIRRGITRGLPTTREVDGRKFDVRFENLSVYKDGQPEPFHKKEVNNGEMLYIGSANVLLEAGDYVYEINYTVPNQTIYGKDSDQLLWNAIGADVSFDSDKATVKIELPEDANVKEAKAYVGKFGSPENQSRVFQTTQGNVIEFYINEGLRPNEAVTTDLIIEKGLIAKPTFLEKFGSGLALLLASLLMLIYFVYTWFKYGRDPAGFESALLYDTPENLSPASINYIYNESFEDRALTSSIISLATKGYISIIHERGKKLFFGVKESFELEKLKPATDELPPEEAVILENLFNRSNQVRLNGSYQENVKHTIAEHKRSVLAQHKAFVKEGSNLKFIFIPILITIVAAISSIVLNNIFGLGSQQYLVNLFIFIPLALVGIFVYRYLIIQPTVEQLNLKAEINGFKDYIATNQSGRELLSDAPELNVGHFENLLPYAYAFGVEKNWSAIFDDKIKEATYRPRWSNSYNNAYLFHAVFSRTMSRSGYKEPPASSGGGFSSGGGGGGGFSGGGGGGGSVGGW